MTLDFSSDFSCTFQLILLLFQTFPCTFPLTLLLFKTFPFTFSYLLLLFFYNFRRFYVLFYLFFYFIKLFYLFFHTYYLISLHKYFRLFHNSLTWTFQTYFSTNLTHRLHPTSCFTHWTEYQCMLNKNVGPNKNVGYYKIAIFVPILGKIPTFWKLSSLETTIFRQNRQIFRRTFLSPWLIPHFVTLMGGNRGHVLPPIRAQKFGVN